MYDYVIIYEMKNGTEQVQEVRNYEEFLHESEHARREVHSKGTYVEGYRVELISDRIP